jgi:hypothetical protein
MMAVSNYGDLPPALASLLNVSNVPTMPTSPMGIGTASLAQPAAMPSYQMGGMIGPGGMPAMGNMPLPMSSGIPTDQLSPSISGAPSTPGLAAPGSGQQSLPPGQIIPEAKRFVQQNPQQVERIIAELQKIIQSGEITLEELNTVSQMARAAAQNPALYPQLRRIAIEREMADPDVMSEQFDSGLVFVLVLIGEVLNSNQMALMQMPEMQGGQMPMQGGQMPMQGGQMPQMQMPQAMSPDQMPQGMPQMPMQGGQMPSFKQGGPLPDGGKDRPVVIRAHEGEYVIPAHVVRAKGTDFFDKMLESYNSERKNA